MPHATPNVSADAAPARRAASATNLINRAKTNLGVETIAEIAVACGLSKSTLERLVANPQNAIARNLVRFSDTTGIPVTDVLGTTASTTALPEAA